jgi:hypothetical protein
MFINANNMYKDSQYLNVRMFQFSENTISNLVLILKILNIKFSKPVLC